jgi:hypothetical protein
MISAARLSALVLASWVAGFHSEEVADKPRAGNQELRQLSEAPRKKASLENILAEAKAMTKNEGNFSYGIHSLQANIESRIQYLKSEIKLEEELPASLTEVLEKRIKLLTESKARLEAQNPKRENTELNKLAKKLSLMRSLVGSNNHSADNLEGVINKLNTLNEIKNKNLTEAELSDEAVFEGQPLKDKEKLRKLKNELERLTEKESKAFIEECLKLLDSDSKLVFLRAKYNIDKEPDALLEFFPSIIKRIKNKSLTRKSILSEIAILMKQINGGHIGKNPPNKVHSLQDVSSPFDDSTKFLLAAAWIATRPVDFEPINDRSYFPKTLLQISGVIIKSPAKRIVAYNTTKVTVVHSFNQTRYITTALHEFCHQRDVFNSDLLFVNNYDGILEGSKNVPDLFSNGFIFAEKLKNDPSLCEGIITDPSDFLKNIPEITAYIHSEFLSPDSSWPKRIEEAHSPLFSNLVKYYGFNPLEDGKTWVDNSNREGKYYPANGQTQLAP